MNAPLITFIVAAVLLIVGTLGILLPPLLRGRRLAEDQRARDNLAILRDQRAELEREHAEGSLADADYREAQEELKRRLLEESSTAANSVNTGAAPQAARKTALLLALALPLLALGGYALFGNPRALSPQPAERPPITQAQVEAMVGKLAERLKTNPDDAKGWLMLGRSYRALGRFAEASEAYRHAGKLIDNDAEELANWAEAAARAADGRFAGEPERLLKRALKADPQSLQALMLAGAAAMQRGDKKAAADYWERILPLLDPNSEDAQMIKDAVAKARNGN